jgi:hypothetical protein
MYVLAYNSSILVVWTFATPIFISLRDEVVATITLRFNLVRVGIQTLDLVSDGDC